MTDDEKKAAFKEKLKTIQFGIVPGAHRATSSTSYYDKQSLPNFPSREEVLDERASIKNTPIKEMKLADLAIDEN